MRREIVEKMKARLEENGRRAKGRESSHFLFAQSGEVPLYALLFPSRGQSEEPCFLPPPEVRQRFGGRIRRHKMSEKVRQSCRKFGEIFVAR